MPSLLAPNLRSRVDEVLGPAGEFLGVFLAGSANVSFGPFLVDRGSRQVLRGADRQPVHLSPKAYELLLVLLDRRPQAIAKGELHERLWPSTFVSEATLASLVGDLRHALGDTGHSPRYIRTVHGFGYSFSGVAEDTRRPPGRPSPVTDWIAFDGREIALAVGVHVVGRDKDIAITLPSPSVSRRHARIDVIETGAVLEDLGSKNGTYIRGARVSSPTALTDGDRIRIGAFELTYRRVTAADSTETEG